MQSDMDPPRPKGASSAAETRQQGAPEGERSFSKTIMIVEDDPDTGEFFRMAFLQETPYHIYWATSGNQAIHFCGQIRPNLFILDYRLPDMTGLELHDKLHALTGFEAIPTLLLSASRVPEEQAVQRHITYMEKPLDLEEFMNTVDRLLLSS
ncbi:MAG TPA: response regulator [Ktedonobacteraceae bacterium]|nr:response regulator [Ktedonobacteraceae bacterium]